MKIQFVMGGAGSGKSHFLYTTILEEAEKNLSKKYFFIVPEQGNLQVQRELVKLSRKKSLMNVDVLSFMRLAHRTFEEEGVDNKLVLEDTGKSMVVRKLLNKLGKEFLYFKKAGKKSGFTEEMKSIVTEFMQYSVEEESLETLIADESLSPVIKAKLHDIKLLYSAFKDFKKEKYIVAEKLMDLLSETIDASALYNEAVFVFDGFTGFTPTQFHVIRSLMKKAHRLFFSFTMDRDTFLEEKTADFKLFYLSKTMVLKLTKLAEENRVEMMPPIFVKPHRDKGAISKIEADIFRMKRVETYEDREDEVSIYALKSPKEEAELVLMKLWELVKEKGYRFREIAIVSGDLDEYGEVLYDVLTKGGVPAFLDQKKTIFDNPLIEFVRASLLVVEDNFSYEAIMRYLRSGLSGIWKSRTDRFENYILAKGIKGGKKYASKYFGKEEGCEEIDYIRKKIYQVFYPLGKALKSKKKNIKEKTMALYTFLKAHRVEEKLYGMYKSFEEKGETLQAKEYAKCYEMVIGVFEKMVELLGEEVFDAEEFAKILEAGFLEGKAGFIPSGLDRVTIGDIKRTRFSGIKALFFVGVNDGKVPKTISKKGIFTDKEREKLGKLMELAPSLRERAFTELFYLYMLFSLPTERLILSYSSTGMDGKALRPSYIVEKIRTLFKDKKIHYLSEEKRIFIEDLRRDKGLRRLLPILREGRAPEEEDLALMRYYLAKGDDFLPKLLSGCKAKPIGKRLDEALALQLYGDSKGSITRLENFVECPFSHFLTHGLSLKEREAFELKSFQLGTIYHEVLERFSKKVIAEGKSFGQVSEVEKKAWIAESMRETVEDGYEVMLSSGKNRYKLSKIQRIVEKTVWALCHQLEEGGFSPTFFEEAFLSEQMKGRIDRIDTALSDFLPNGLRLSESEKAEDKKYLKVEYARIIDYKSGKKSFDINDTYYGLDLQLIAYIRHMKNLLKSKPGHENHLIIPTGAYYYQIEDPIRKKGEGEEAFLKELRLDGLTVDLPFALHLTDEKLVDFKEEKLSIKPSATSDVIYAGTKKEGVFSKNSAVYPKEDLNSLVTYSKEKMKEIRADILRGEIQPSPYKMGEKRGCDYCRYESICRFKTGLTGYKYRIFKTLSEEEIFEKIREKNGETVDDGAEGSHKS